MNARYGPALPSSPQLRGESGAQIVSNLTSVQRRLKLF
jgi:hypothetical protein